MIDVFLLDKNLNKIHIIDNYTSLIWVNRYNQVGDCELMIPASITTLNKIKQAKYISRDDDDMVCSIKKIELSTDEENGNHLIVSGVDVKNILNQRIIWNQTNVSGSVENYVRKLITENIISPKIADRKIENFALDERMGFTETIREQVTYAKLGDKIKEICEKYEWGYKIFVSDNKKFVFRLYKGADVSDYVIFSDDYENLSSTTYVNDASNIVNVVLTAGEGEGVKRVTATTGEGVGIERYEEYVDARSVSKTIDYTELVTTYPEGSEVTVGGKTYYQVDGVNVAEIVRDETTVEVTLTDEIYKESLISLGEEVIAESGITTSFEGEIEPRLTFVYKENYFLGDTVTIENEYGISVKARIVEIIEVYDDNGYSIEPKFEYKRKGRDTSMFLASEDERILLTEFEEELEVEQV